MLASADLLAQTAQNAAAGKTTARLEDWKEQKLAGGALQRERRCQLSDFWSRYALRYSQTIDADGKKHRSGTSAAAWA